MAEVDAGPIIVARPGLRKTVVLGFHPALSAMRFELATPLLFANILRWIAPETFRNRELRAQSVGTVNVALESDVDPASVRVVREDGSAIPFTLEGRSLHFFSGAPGTARVVAGDRESVYSLSLPELGDTRWQAPEGTRRGLPTFRESAVSSRDLWQLFAVLGGSGLLLEWLLFGAFQPGDGPGAQPIEVAVVSQESVMTFARSWVIVLAFLPIAWAAWEWRTSARRAALALKATALFFVIAALSEPRLNFNDSKVAVAALVDTSASVSPADLASASELLNAMEKKRGRDVLQVIPFARAGRNPSIAEHTKSWNIGFTRGDAGRATNLESAIRDAVADLPAGMVHRVALISDGHENVGTVTRATWQAQQLDIAIDTFAMAGRPKPNLRADSVSLPSQVFSGERFPIDLTVTSPSAASATVVISAEGKKLGSSTVEVQPGANHFRVRTSLTAVGAVDLAGVISAPGLGESRFEQAVTVRRPHVLILSQDPAGSESHLLQTLAANQFDVQQSAQQLPAKLDGFQTLVFNNWDMDNIPAADKARIEQFEQQGGGVLWIAGEKNIYVEKKPGTPEDPLERAFPAKLAPPRSPEGTCVVLIIDKSSSMEGKKMELARLASIGVINNLRPVDTVGILIFDNSFQWAVPIRKAEDKTLIERLIAGITPDGGTQIAPALSEAYHKVAGGECGVQAHCAADRWDLRGR